MKNYKLIIYMLVVVLVYSCQTDCSKPCKSSTYPSWLQQSNVYEVNTRQYTPEGTFAAFEEHLPRLKDMGVDILWFMPIHPISKKERKRDTSQLGSYYAIADYRAINPEHGTIDDFKHLVNKAHELGFKVIIDWVANHTGCDHYWLETQPDFYKKNEKGETFSPHDWTDTKQLDLSNKALVDTMIDCMKFWLKETGIDGFRCDVASMVPSKFWRKCIKELKKVKNDIFMLAEADNPSLIRDGFHATYAWHEFHLMKEIVKKHNNAKSLDTALAFSRYNFPSYAVKLFFTSNHDENSWNKADFETMPGESHAPFAVLTNTLLNAIPLIYSGQEEPFLDSLKFFVKDTINFKEFKRAKFYKILHELRKRNNAFRFNTSYIKLKSFVAEDKEGDNDDKVFSFIRQKGDDKVLVITNLSDQTVSLILKNENIKGKAEEVFTEKQIEFTKKYKSELAPWAYKVYEYEK